MGRLLPSLAMLVVALPAQEPMAALRARLPDAVVMVVESAAPGRAIAELRQAIGELPEALPTAVRAPLVVGLLALWATVQGNPEAWADRMAGGGACVGWLPGRGGLQPIAVLRPHDLAAATAWLQRFDGVASRVVDDVLVVARDAELCQLVGTSASAAGRWAAVDFGAPAAVRAVVDLASVRRLAGAAAPRLAALNGGGRFLLAPLVHALEHASWLRAALTGGARLKVSAQADASLRSAPFGRLLSASAARAWPLANDGLLSLRVDRSFGVLLGKPEAFLAEADVQAVRGFLSIADAIDGVRTSFVDDLLGGLEEPFQLHVLPVVPVDEGPAPRLQLPGFAVVAGLRREAAVDVLFRAAQLFLLIANAERAQRGKPLFTARLERGEHGRGFVAEPAPWRRPGLPPIEQGLSPTLWCENGVVVLASTRAAALAMVQAAGAAERTTADGDQLVLRGPAIAAALRWSRSAFELARQLDEGEERAAAAQFFDVAFTVLDALREVSVQVRCGADATHLELGVERQR